MGLLVFKQPAGCKSQPLVKFCLLFIREVYIPCEAFEFISDHLTLFIANTHYSTPYLNREFDFGSRPPPGQICPLSRDTDPEENASVIVIRPPALPLLKNRTVSWCLPGNLGCLFDFLIRSAAHLSVAA
jgi:hypothetical protein